MKKEFSYLLLGGFVIFLWQYLAINSVAVRLYVSSPSIIVDYFTSNYIDLFQALFVTATEAIVGLLIAIIFSFSVMVLCFYKKSFLDFILPIMITSQVIPIIVLAPFFVLLFGIGISSKILMAAVISFFPIFISFVQGYKAIPNNIHELMAVYNSPLSFKIKNVYFPLSMPSIMAGLKVSVNLAIIGAIVAEFTGAKVGIGKNLFVSAIRLDSDLMMTSLILATLLGLVLYGIVNLIDKRVGFWYQ